MRDDREPVAAPTSRDLRRRPRAPPPPIPRRRPDRRRLRRPPASRPRRPAAPSQAPPPAYGQPPPPPAASAASSRATASSPAYPPAAGRLRRARADAEPAATSAPGAAPPTGAPWWPSLIGAVVPRPAAGAADPGQQVAVRPAPGRGVAELPDLDADLRHRLGDPDPRADRPRPADRGRADVADPHRSWRRIKASNGEDYRYPLTHPAGLLSHRPTAGSGQQVADDGVGEQPARPG